MRHINHMTDGDSGDDPRSPYYRGFDEDRTCDECGETLCSDGECPECGEDDFVSECQYEERNLI